MIEMIASMALSTGHLPSVSEIENRIRAAYSKAGSCQDTVRVCDALHHGRLLGKVDITFTTRHRFRFVVHRYRAKETSTIIGNAGDKHQFNSYYGKPDPYLKYQLFNNLEASMTMPYTVVMSSLLGDEPVWVHTNWSAVTREAVNGRDCFRLYSWADHRTHLMWVDAKSYLVVKAREQYFLNFDADEVYLFHSRVK